jgi:hypothetical protein
MKRLIISIIFLTCSQTVWAQRHSGSYSTSESRMTYDISGSFGTYNDRNYNELTLGLNWYMSDWFNWRNAAFTRFGNQIDSVSGLDSSARFQWTAQTDGGAFGVNGFIGPGVRLASANHNAAFGEAGLVFKLGGLRIGGGVKSLYYLVDRTDSATNATLPRNDNQVFLILSGSGTL